MGVVAYGVDVLEHLLEAAGDVDFADRLSELAVADADAGRAAREVAGGEVDAETHQGCEVEAVFNVGDDLVGGRFACGDDEIAGADRGEAADIADGGAGGGGVEAAGVVTVEEEAAKDAGFEQGAAARGYAFAVEGARAELARESRIVLD